LVSRDSYRHGRRESDQVRLRRLSDAVGRYTVESFKP